jgi:hypothetical protein
MWHGFLLNGIWACSFLLAAQCAVPRWRASGLAVAFLLSYLVHTITTAVYCLLTFARYRVRRAAGATVQFQDERASVSA